jgi:hypothetical protein
MTYTAASDPYAQRSTEISSQARGAAAITPSDTVDLPVYAKALMVTAAGTVSVLPIAEYVQGNTTAVALGNLPVGYIIPIQVARVFASGTSATVIGLYN